MISVADATSEELGTLDHSLLVEESAAELTEIIADIGEGFRQRSESLNNLSGEMATLQRRGNRATTKDRIIVVRRVASEMEEYAAFLSTKNEQYSAALDKAQSSLEELVRGQDVSNPDVRKQLEDLLNTLDESEAPVESFRSVVGETASIVQAMPGVEKNLIRTRNELTKQFRYLEANAQQTVSMMSRARQIGNEKLRGFRTQPLEDSNNQ